MCSRSELLFLEYFNRANRGIVHCRREVDFDFSLGRGLNVGKALYQRLAAGFTHNIEISEEHNSIAPDIEDPTPVADILVLDTKPPLEEVKLNGILPSGNHRHCVMKMADALSLVKTTIGHLGYVISNLAGAAAKVVTVR